jgi:hypothetical protein
MLNLYLDISVVCFLTEICLPRECMSFQIYKTICKEFYAAQSALLHGNVNKSSSNPKFSNIRYFNTTCSNHDKQQSSQQSKDPDKKPDKDEEIKVLLRKLSMLFLLLYVLLLTFKKQVDTSDTEVSFP